VSVIGNLFPPTDMKWHEKATKRFASPFVGVNYDRIDVDPIILAHAAVLFGYTIKDFYTKPELAVRLVAYANELYDLLPVTHWFYSNVWIDALGAKLQPTETLPYIVIEPRPIQKPEDVDKLHVPDVDEISKSMCAQLFFRAYDYTKENIPHMFVPIAFAFCLYGMAAELVGPERFIVWTRRQPKLCHKLLEKVTETAANAAIAIARRYGFAMLVMGSVLANTTTLSPKDVKEFSFDYHMRYIKKAFKGGAGPQLWYHLCGDHSADWPIWKEVVVSPFTVLHIGYYKDEPFPADLMKKEFGDKLTIMVSVDTKLMIEPDFNRVYEQAKKQLLASRDSPRGCILGTACETPVPTNPGNILALVKAARDFGTYGTW